jgi:hypothetical protein
MAPIRRQSPLQQVITLCSPQPHSLPTPLQLPHRVGLLSSSARDVWALLFDKVFEDRHGV